MWKTAGERLIGGALLAGSVILAGRALRINRRHLYNLTGLRNGHRALTIGPINQDELATIIRLVLPKGQLVELLPDERQTLLGEDSEDGDLAVTLVCDPGRPPFVEQSFDSVVLVEDSCIESLVTVLKPAGVLSLIQTPGWKFRSAFLRRRQLEAAGLEVIDTNGRGLAYVINARRPVRGIDPR